MIVPSLFAYLRWCGVELVAETPTDAPTRLRVRSPVPLVPVLKEMIAAHRDDLLQFVVELEERAGVIEADEGCSPDEAMEAARKVVTGGTASPDGKAWLRELITRSPVYRDCPELFDGLEDVRLIRESEAA